MRLVLRSLLLLFVLYVVLVGGLFFTVERVLDDSAWDAMEETATILGREAVSALDRELSGTALETDPAARARLAREIDDFVARSNLVNGAVVLDAEGQVLAGTGIGSRDRPFPSFSELFGEDPRPRLARPEGSSLRSGTFFLDLPLSNRGASARYVRLSLAPRRLGVLYSNVRETLLTVAGVGLVIMGGTGFLLHLTLSGRERELARILDRLVEDRETAEGGSERRASPVLQAAGRLREAFYRERQRIHITRRRLAEAVRLLDVGVIQLTSDGELEFVGDRAREILGLPEQHPEEAWRRLGPLLPELRSAGESEEALMVDLELPESLGGRVVRLQLLRSADPEDGLIGLVRDRALLDALETDLAMAARLRNLTRLYVGVAHDLKAPLNAMVLNLELLKKSLRPGDDDRRLKWVGVVEREIARLRRGLELLLDQTAPSRQERRVVDLREVVERACELLAPQARQQGVRIDNRLPPEPVFVAIQLDLMTQAMINLAINSLEAMPDGGTLRFELATLEDEARLVIRDTGAGVSPEVRDRIFDLHVTSKTTGTGIGLYVARSVARALGGSLDLLETGPDGTAFEWRLAVASMVEPQTTAASEDAP